MLRINNTNILLQAEIPAYGECVTSCIPYLANAEETENFFQNIEIKESVKLSECEGKTVALSIEQFAGFVNSWHDKSSFLKLHQWTLNEWLDDYLHDNKQVAEYLGLSETCDSKAYFPDYAKLYLESIDLNAVEKQTYLLIDEETSPEISWCIEDYLAHRIFGGESKYKELIEECIYESYISAQQVEIAKKINRGAVIENYICTDLDLDRIEINEDAIDLFCPCEDEFFHTNISHIRKTIRRYIAMGGK